MFFAFVADPHFEEVLREHIALEQEIVVLFQAIQRFAEAAGHIRNFLQFFRRQFVNVFVQRFAGIDLVQHAIQSGHEQRGVAEVRIRGRIRRAIFDALGFRDSR